jgi:hypothetical protein
VAEKKKRPEQKQRGQGSFTPSNVADLVRNSGFIFTGTVVEHGKSSVPTLPARENLLVVRLDRSLRADPVLGDLTGKMVTVLPRTPGALRVGQKAVFLANSWIHDRGIAVREVEHMDPQQEDFVAAAVSQLPQAHLADRIKSAGLVVDATVTRITPVERKTFERNAALWVAAELKVKRVLSGKPHQLTILYFPTSDHPLWASAPRFKERQEGIFILHPPFRGRTRSEASLDSEGWVALDPGDFQPASELNKIERLITEISAEGGTR